MLIYLSIAALAVGVIFAVIRMRSRRRLPTYGARGATRVPGTLAFAFLAAAAAGFTLSFTSGEDRSGATAATPASTVKQTTKTVTQEATTADSEPKEAAEPIAMPEKPTATLVLSTAEVGKAIDGVKIPKEVKPGDARWVALTIRDEKSRAKAKAKKQEKPKKNKQVQVRQRPKPAVSRPVATPNPPPPPPAAAPPPPPPPAATPPPPPPPAPKPRPRPKQCTLLCP